jgi:hypothetical protein
MLGTNVNLAFNPRSVQLASLPNRLGESVGYGGAGEEDGHAEGRHEGSGRVKGCHGDW